MRQSARYVQQRNRWYQESPVLLRDNASPHEAKQTILSNQQTE